jgi:hypothetical protein
MVGLIAEVVNLDPSAQNTTCRIKEERQGQINDPASIVRRLQ